MITKQRIDQFYKDVDELDLKFPVASIADATGESKGNVSKYLKKKLEPSESFLNRFYEKFQKGSKKVSEGNSVTWNQSRDDGFKDKYIALLEEKANGFSSDDLKQRLDEIQAGQLTARHFLGRLLAKVEKQPVDKIESEINKFLNVALKAIGSGGK